MQSNLRLDWKIRLLDWLLRLNKPLDQLSLEELRQLSETPIPFVVERLMGGKRIPVLSVMDQMVEGRHGAVPIRLYYPSSKQNLPLILFFHGGGWVYPPSAEGIASRGRGAFLRSEGDSDPS